MINSAVPNRTTTNKPKLGKWVSTITLYLLVIAVFSVTKLIDPVKNWMASTDIKIHWPGLDGHVLTAAGVPVPRSETGATIAEVAGKVRFGAPYALKGLGFAHKTEAGAVRLGLSSLDGRRLAIYLQHGR